MDRRRGKLGWTSAMLACTLLLATTALPSHAKSKQRQPTWGNLDSPLRPGASMGGCTFNFVFYKPGSATKAPKAYIGTAAHCTTKVGDEIAPPQLGAIGKVVYDSDTVKGAENQDFYVDFALIEIYPQFVSKTNPQVLHWGGPTRIATDEDLAVGDQVDVYGYGLGVGLTEQTRPRYGYLFNWTDEEYQADMPAVNGDSGAPLIHHETGAALGIISRYGFTLPPSTDLGPRISWILEELNKAGLAVKLATVKG